jgi:NADH-quinone oxidoreductase subunit G/NADP-reducing hydrogenase subunit HndD
MKITINGTEVEAAAGETVLKVARRAGITIPHLCSLDWAPSPSASCRLCVVEVEGLPRLQTSCTLEATAGMAVTTHSPRVLKARRAILELLIASHPQDCLSCVRSGSCELAELAGDLGVRERRYVGAVRQHPVDVSSPALWRDPNKCVLCGRCVTVCHSVQGVGAIDFAARGYRTRVAPGFSDGLNVSDCVYCGQCARVCPTGAIVERSQVDDVIAALADPDAVVVAQVAPAVPATLADEGADESVTTTIERLAAALKRVGFDAVFDTSFAADLTVMEEASELLDRVQNGGVLPLFTSCSPAWVRYVETQRPDLIPHLSTCKSPQQMAGALIKEVYPRYAGVGDRRLVVVSLMPCTAKKAEARDLSGVDHVLTTRELERLWDRFGVDFGRSTDRAALDAPFSQASGAGRLFAGSGGVMEAALRTAHLMVAGDELAGGPQVVEARGSEDVRHFTVTAGPAELNLAVVSGLGRLAATVDDLLAADPPLHFVEVMSCPGGCVGGGGQPYGGDDAAVRRRLERLYAADGRARARRAHENEQVKAMYDDLLGRPLGEVSHRLLHRTYSDRSRAATQGAARS